MKKGASHQEGKVKFTFSLGAPDMPFSFATGSALATVVSRSPESLRFLAEELKPLGAPAFEGEHNRGVFTELGPTDEDPRFGASARHPQRSLEPISLAI